MPFTNWWPIVFLWLSVLAAFAVLLALSTCAHAGETYSSLHAARAAHPKEHITWSKGQYFAGHPKARKVSRPAPERVKSPPAAAARIQVSRLVRSMDTLTDEDRVITPMSQAEAAVIYGIPLSDYPPEFERLLERRSERGSSR